MALGIHHLEMLNNLLHPNLLSLSLSLSLLSLSLSLDDADQALFVLQCAPEITALFNVRGP